MASVVEVYKATEYQIHQTQNGELTYADFNAQSKLAEIWMLGWLSSEKMAIITPFDSQKNKDWLSPVLKKYPANADSGFLEKPADYYKYDNMFSLDLVENDCDDSDDNEDENTIQKVKRIPIELLSGQQFQMRANTYITGLKPSPKKPIAKEVGKTFEYLPEDIGAVTLEYVSYPDKYGEIVTKVDQLYNEEVTDTLLSTDYVWGDWAIEVLAWRITQNFSVRTRDGGLLQLNQVTNPVQ